MTFLRATRVLLVCALYNFQQSTPEKLYSGYRVYSVRNLSNETQLNAILRLQERKVDFWNEPNYVRKTDIMVSPAERSAVEADLKYWGIDYSVVIDDVERLVTEDKLVRQNRQNSNEMNWQSYQRLSVIHNWLDQIAIYSPGVARVSSIGRSTEGRNLKMLTISYNPFKQNPVIYIDGGIHAREWIAPAVVTYIIGRLMSADPEDKDIFENIDWHFVPVVNPDGYEFSHSEDRLWRKSRSRHNGDECVGVDLNRNFNFHWNEVGTKSDPCANTYAGPFQLSEPEANSTVSFMLANRNRIRSYITFHSYSQLFLTPYGYTEELADDYEEMEDLGLRAAKALENVHGTEYEVGPPSHILYSNSGSSRDWAKGVAGIKYPFTIELRDKGDVGFLLPPEEIIPTAEETYEAVKVIARQVLEEFGTR